MQPFIADATTYTFKNIFFLPLKTWQNGVQNLLIIGTNLYFTIAKQLKARPNLNFCWIKKKLTARLMFNDFDYKAHALRYFWADIF